MLPEFSNNITVRGTFDVFEGPDEMLGYDAIIGRDLTEEMGIDLRYSDQTIIWDGMAVKMHEYSGNDDPRGLKQKDIYAMLSQDAKPAATK